MLRQLPSKRLIKRGDRIVSALGRHCGGRLRRRLVGADERGGDGDSGLANELDRTNFRSSDGIELVMIAGDQDPAFLDCQSYGEAVHH